MDKKKIVCFFVKNFSVYKIGNRIHEKNQKKSEVIFSKRIVI